MTSTSMNISLYHEEQKENFSSLVQSQNYLKIFFFISQLIDDIALLLLFFLFILTFIGYMLHEIIFQIYFYVYFIFVKAKKIAR